MKLFTSLAMTLVALLAAGVATDAKEIIENFPYCPCIEEPAAYHLEPTVTYKANNTYCFRIKVDPPPGCNTYCCRTADLKKIEIDANPECKIGGQVLRATINGKQSQTAPLVDRSFAGPPGTFVLKLTNIGLTHDTADGAEICYTLGTNNAGKGCTSLEAMCKPPAGSAPGTCTAALFDSKNDCCPVTDVGRKPCKTCVYFSLTPNGPTFDQATCDTLSESVIDMITEGAEFEGATISSPFELVTCGTYVKICGEFASESDGAKLQKYVGEVLEAWLAELIDTDGKCASGLAAVVSIGGDGPNALAPPKSCLYGRTSKACSPDPFPACVCNITAGITPFSIGPEMVGGPSRPGTYSSCFVLETSAPSIEGPCALTTVAQKLEIFADDTMRGMVKGFAIKPNGANTYKYISASWGKRGENTLKATPLAWTMEQANGGLVCLELKRAAKFTDVCLGGEGRCIANVFDPTKKCCPVYKVKM